MFKWLDRHDVPMIKMAKNLNHLKYLKVDYF